MSEENKQNAVIKSELFGRVKWFNNRLGYGFITTISNSSESVSDQQDVFVHHNSIGSEDDTYKYLVQGEYVQFNLVETHNNTYKVQAETVRGVFNGPLMCDVHNEQKKHSTHISQNRQPREQYYSTRDDTYDIKPSPREPDDTYNRRRPYVQSHPTSYSHSTRVYPEQNRAPQSSPTPRSARPSSSRP
jgi:cold shock CspA family protein